MNSENVKKETKKEKRVRVFPNIQERLGITIREVLDDDNNIRWVLTGNTKPVKELFKQHGLFFHATPYTPDVARAGITEPHWETDRPRKFDALLDDLVNEEKTTSVVEAQAAEEVEKKTAEEQLKSLVETSPGDVTMPWGKHQGKKLSEIPLDYVEWLASNFETKEPLRTAARKVAAAGKVKESAKMKAIPAGDMVLSFGKHAGKKLSEIPLDYVEWLSREARDSSVRAKAAEWVAAQKTVAPPVTTFYNSPPPNVPTPAADPHDIVRRHGRTPKPEAKPLGFSRNLGFGKRVEAIQDAPKVGEVVKGKSGPMVVVSVGEPRYYTSDMLDDFDMFGDEPGWQIHYTAIAVERTAEEQSSEDKKQAEIQKRKAAKEYLEGAFKIAEYTPKPTVAGETYRMPLPRAGYGVYSRTSYRIDSEGGKIWEVRENGADGDDWSHNNFGMSVARFVPYTEELATTIREVGELLK